jgi:(p)ppGpp synthase/HD superfamily hydrolase
VYSILVDVTDDTEVCARLLYDTTEDTDTTFNELKNAFTPNVAEKVKMATYKETDENKFFPEMKHLDDYNVQYHKAVLTKFDDRLSNLSRMESWSDERRYKYINSSRFWQIKELSIRAKMNQI